MLVSLLAQSVTAVRAALKDALPSTDDYDVIAAAYADDLFDAFIGFASSSGRGSRAYRNAASRAVVEAVPAAFYRGYQDAGGEDTEPDDESWLTARQDAERGYLPGVFDWLAEQRDAETITEDAVRARVDNWVAGLSGVYAEGKLRGAKNKMLTFDGSSGKESCKDCQRYLGQRHSAKWWTNRDLVRRNGNDNYECGRWEPCDHHFYTDDGEEYAP